MFSTQEHEQNVLAHAAHREREIYQYQVNIDNYTAILSGLPTDDCPANIAGFLDIPLASVPLSISDADAELLAKYQYRDQLRILLRTEKAEQSKSLQMLAVLRAQIGSDYSEKVSTFLANKG